MRSNAAGICPDKWLDNLADCFHKTLSREKIKINQLLRGGHIVRSHPGSLPWLQEEVSRTGRLSGGGKIQVLWKRYLPGVR
jgi:hypothetical protein